MNNIAENTPAVRVSVNTLGCKSNQYDSSALEDVLKRASFRIVPFPGLADVYIINTCTVTGRTDYQSRQLVRRVRKINPEAIVIVTGCYAQVSSDELSRMDGIDYIIGNPEKGKILDYISKGRQANPRVEVGHYEDGTPLSLRARSSGGRTRANFKVQEGCNRACSYCIIPRARGLSKSVPLKDAEREIDSLVESGFQEIILTGIHLGAYGADLHPATDIATLLSMIEANNYPCRFRISSLDPDEVTEELIGVMKSARSICNHLHLPLQSGDNKIIRQMKRPYTRELFAEKVEKLSASVPGISIGVDVIAGFPDEGETEFENTYSLLNVLPVSYLHIFPFSKRPGTAAADHPNQVSPREIKERCNRLRELDIIKRTKFHKAFLGKSASVLAEAVRDKKTGLLKGRARNYIPVLFEGADKLKRNLVSVVLSGFDGDSMIGAAEKRVSGGGV
ncbi:MAG: tRNA (N(6)-L-threonylcarbamoyladenosine(37)-C(2))-methylthiotransferase MtaB [Deltaproteobacteria bacterium]|nr:tRNA (N(6)-L-threonylcarbamoyladenosine(37)-C(2))-methylthiotransferase MtaB [Deltaproteobacteria bacterium]